MPGGGRRYRYTVAYDAGLADRIRELLGPLRGVDEKRMFGGLAFLINGKMSVAVSQQGGILVRIPPEETGKLLGRAHANPMVMAGREIRGWIRVDADGVTTKRQLSAWVARGVDYACRLPPT